MSDELCQRVLELVGDRAEAVVRVRRGNAALTRFANSFIHQNMAELSTSAVLTLVVGGRLATARTSRLDDAGLSELVDRAMEAARLRPPDEGWPGTVGAEPALAVDHWDQATADAGPDQRAQVVRAFVSAGGADLEAAGYCDTVGQHVALATTGGQSVSGRWTRATTDGIFRTGTGEAPVDGSAAATAAALSDLDGAAVGERAAALSRRALGPVELAPGRYEVVMAPSCVANMVQFLVGYGFNAKAHAEGQSFAHLGEGQFDAALDLWDDAGDPRAVGLGFDAEGTPKRRAQLVRAGVTVGLCHDRRTAAGAGTASTGHATEDGERWGPRPTNLFLGPAGGSGARPLVERVERGVLVTDLWYTRILDPKTQVVTGLTRNGVFLVEGGEVVGPVANLRFTQSFVAALGPGQVLGLGDDARLVDGWCHTPSLHLASWNFTGGARG